MSIVRLHAKLVAMCCLVEGLSFDLCHPMMSCSWRVTAANRWTLVLLSVSQMTTKDPRCLLALCLHFFTSPHPLEDSLSVSQLTSTRSPNILLSKTQSVNGWTTSFTRRPVLCTVSLLSSWTAGFVVKLLQVVPKMCMRLH